MNKKKLGLILLTYIILSNFHYGLVNSGANLVNSQSDTSSDILVKSSDAQYECIDAWIIIGGDRSDHHAWDLVLLTLEWVYDQALACGNTDDEILMLVPLHSVTYTTREYAATSRNNLDYAFNDWAPMKVGPNGVLAVYIHDHGGTDAMAMAPFPSLAAWELDQYLDDFEAASGCDRIIVIYEACSSGSFLDELSKSDRIVMTSTEPGYSAWWSPIPPHISMFGEGLIKSILAGNSIGDAFVDANNEIITLGYGDVQHPCIDDNHDGMGHIVNAWGQLPSSGDGNDAKNTYICQGCMPIFIMPPQLLHVPLKFWLKYTTGMLAFPITIGVDNSTEIASVICRVISEDWTPPEPTDNESMGLWDENENAFQWKLSYQGNGNFSGRVTINSPVLDSNYLMSFFVEDVDGRRGQIISTQFGVNEDGEKPSDITSPTIYIINPSDGANISGIVDVRAEGNDDQALDKIQILIDGTQVKEETMPSYYPYPEVNYSLDTSKYIIGTHIITAIAIDKANNTKSISITVNFGVEEESWLDKIPGYNIFTIYAGSLLGIIIVFTRYLKTHHYKKKNSNN